MLETIISKHNPCKYADLLKQLPADLANAFNTSQNGLMKALGINPFDIAKLDKKLESVDAGYDSTNCTYNGKSGVSMHTFLEMKYGKSIASICERLLK